MYDLFAVLYIVLRDIGSAWFTVLCAHAVGGPDKIKRLLLMTCLLSCFKVL